MEFLKYKIDMDQTNKNKIKLIITIIDIVFDWINDEIIFYNFNVIIFERINLFISTTKNIFDRTFIT